MNDREGALSACGKGENVFSLPERQIQTDGNEVNDGNNIEIVPVQLNG